MNYPLAKTYKNHKSLRLTDRQCEILKNLAETWHRNECQVLRDALEMANIAEARYERERDRPAVDPIQVTDVVLFEKEEPCAG